LNQDVDALKYALKDHNLFKGGKGNGGVEDKQLFLILKKLGFNMD